MRYAIEQRLRFIDAMLHLYGHINREALTFFFGVSVPQASNDLSEYMKLAPKNMAYNATNKRYECTDSFENHWG